jgi:hypothetical protein
MSHRYRVFKRSWWKDNPAWPNGLEPAPGKKIHICFVDTEEDARRFCTEWNNTHKPGRHSLKAEYESC